MKKRFLLFLFLLLLLPYGASLARGQTDDASPTAAASAQEHSFASAFFVSRNTTLGPEGKEVTSIQWLGSLLIWGLMGLSIVSLGLIGSIAWNQRRSKIVPAPVVEAERERLKQGRYQEMLDQAAAGSAYFTTVLRAALLEAPHGYPAMVRSLEQTADAETTRRLRLIEPLHVLGNVAPMVGLFGTVYGMILAFQTIVAAGGTPSPKMLAAGIGTALTTTFWGLIVAIPALSGYALLRNKIDALTSEADAIAEEIVTHFRPGLNPEAKKKTK
ncbi:MAG: MotA/TolQ/ExbB proton channel family protein [Phycisphaerales bacterium JB038]